MRLSRFSILSLLFPIHALASPYSPCAEQSPTVTLKSGVIIGTTGSVPSSTVTVNKFLGVPFAARPRRFSPPEKPAAWNKPRNATEKPAACIQQITGDPASLALKSRIYNYPPPAAGESEDCLYVNVYAPATTKKSKDPKVVMVWFYGGNLQLGSNAVDMYDGTSFAANQDVIIVSANYRTNVFGFPNAPELPLEERNLGFLDQRLALEWVQENIHAFGGDPDKVTIFGQSAGSSSVDILVTSMRENPPFRAAIMHSGQTALYINHNNHNYAAWYKLLEQLGCPPDRDEVKCVRAAKAKTIKSILEEQQLRFMPVADNVTMLEYPERARASGKIASVPVMLGMNSNEGRYFVYNQTNTLGWLRVFRPDVPVETWEKIMAEYPIESPKTNSPFEQLGGIFTDFVFQCPTGQAANHSVSAGYPTWRYFFDVSFPNNQPFPGLGAYHCAEIPLVFGTYDVVDATTKQKELSEFMQTAWAKFAKDPKSGPGWEQNPVVRVLGVDDVTTVPAAGLEEKCPLFASLAAPEDRDMDNELVINAILQSPVQQEL